MGINYTAAPVDVSEIEGVIETGELPDSAGSVDLDKMWEVVQFILTDGAEQSEPLFAGEPVDPSAMPVIFIVQPDQVRRIADGLTGVTTEALRQRFGTALAAQIVPAQWEDIGLENLTEEVVSAAQAFIEMYTTAAASGSAVVARMDA